jgi:hypothetical protein
MLVISPQAPPRSRSFCCSPQVSCVSGAPGQISDDEVRIPRLYGTFPPQPSAHAAAPSTGDSDDEVLIPRFSHRAALVLCHGVTRFPSRALVFLAFPPVVIRH